MFMAGGGVKALLDLIEKGKEDEVVASAVLVLGSCVQRWVIILSVVFLGRIYEYMYTWCKNMWDIYEVSC